jgi:hypothetical protein
VKSLGITFAFFGIVFTVAAIADLGAGRYDTAHAGQLLRGYLWILPGLLMVLLGMLLASPALSRPVASRASRAQ